MTNREYQRKQHRGSSSSSNPAINIPFNSGTLPAEEWKDQTWYPLTSRLPHVKHGQAAAPQNSGPDID